MPIRSSARESRNVPGKGEGHKGAIFLRVPPCQQAHYGHKLPEVGLLIGLGAHFIAWECGEDGKHDAELSR